MKDQVQLCKHELKSKSKNLEHMERDYHSKKELSLKQTLLRLREEMKEKTFQLEETAIQYEQFQKIHQDCVSYSDVEMREREFFRQIEQLKLEHQSQLDSFRQNIIYQYDTALNNIQHEIYLAEANMQKEQELCEELATETETEKQRNSEMILELQNTKQQNDTLIHELFIEKEKNRSLQTQLLELQHVNINNQQNQKEIEFRKRNFGVKEDVEELVYQLSVMLELEKRKSYENEQQLLAETRAKQKLMDSVINDKMLIQKLTLRVQQLESLNWGT